MSQKYLFQRDKFWDSTMYAQCFLYNNIVANVLHYFIPSSTFALSSNYTYIYMCILCTPYLHKLINKAGQDKTLNIGDFIKIILEEFITLNP